MTSQNKLSPIVTGTRRLILESLLRTDVNAVTLAENLGINISAIRGHLDVLELAGLIFSTYQHATRGRPKRLYTLTPLAYSLFPTQTTSFLEALFQVLVRSLDAKTTNTLIRQVVTRVWQQILPDTPTGNLQDRLIRIVEALDQFGFYVSFDQIGQQQTIVIHNNVFQSALAVLPDALATQFHQDFWNRLSQLLEGIRVRVDPAEARQHRFRVFIEERRE
ncbi:MAG: helix-turn-helix transcriptional regulator [Promethearchaeota archaeon]